MCGNEAVLITGAVLPYLIDEFGLSYSSGGLLLALQAIGNLGASLIGVWTGSLAAALLDMRLKWAFPAIMVGNIIAAILIMTLSNGIMRAFY